MLSVNEITNIVRSAVKEIVAENKNMPVQSSEHICQVTEIIIRVGPPDGLVIIRGGSAESPCVLCCRPHPGFSAPSMPSSYAELSGYLDSGTKDLFQQIAKNKKYSEEHLFHILINRIRARDFTDAISSLAKDMGAKK